MRNRWVNRNRGISHILQFPNKCISVVIKEICYGTTTESLIRSIDEAAKKGKIKIDAIDDYTAEHVEIEVKLVRGYNAEDLIQALYAYTECEVSLSSQVVVIKDDMPLELDVVEILKLNSLKLQEYLKQELEIEKHRFLEKIFDMTLEQIFIENRLYKKIENLTSYDEIHKSIETDLEKFIDILSRVPTYEDRERLLNIPIRRISRFDLDKNLSDIAATKNSLLGIEKSLKNIKKFSIGYLEGLITKYGKDYPRKTEIQTIGHVDLRSIETRIIKLGFDKETGFVGTKVLGADSFECTNFDKLLIMFKDGTYTVINIPEKQYVNKDNSPVVYVGIADKKTVITALYKDPKKHITYGKRFIVTKFILDKVYRYIEEGMKLELLTTQQKVVVDLQLVLKVKQKINKLTVDLNTVLVKSVSAKGIRLSNKEVKKISLLK